MVSTVLRPVDVSAVVLAQARTRTERQILAGWAAEHHPRARVVESLPKPSAGAPPPWSAAALGADETLVVPIRVTWLSTPAPRRRPSEMLAHLSPRRPWGVLQPALVRSSPGRAGVVRGEPATVGELRARFADETATDAASFETFVERAATVACDRAERKLIGDRYKVPRQVVEQITASARFRTRVEELAAKLGRENDEVLAEAESCLGELVTVQSPAAIDAFRTVLSPMHSRAWKVHVDTAGLDRLRDVNKDQALVFLPAHRSYVDPLVLAEVLHQHDFPRNHMLGGNNMRIWPIGPLGKRAGVIFIRRTNSDDVVYKFALREYLGHLTAKKFNLEWYIEGGRTRTGKLRPPKLGLLAYLVRALEDERTEDVAMVPVSIVYDHMNEVGALDAEQGGAAKAAESSRWLARYIRGQQRMDGNAWVQFGEPFSLREALSTAGTGPARLEKVAFRICDGINRATPVTPTALVTFALLGSHDRALTLSEVGRVAAPLLDYLDSRGIPRPDTELSLRQDAGLRDTLDRLVSVGVASVFEGGPEPVWSVTPGQHRVAAFYRNGALHHLVTRAIVELALLHVSAKGSPDSPPQAPMDEVWAEAQRLRDLLKFEFFFPATEQFRADVIAELELLDHGWYARAVTEEGAAELLASSKVLVAHRALRSFLDAQIVVATALAERDPAEEIVEAPFLDECLGLGQQMLLRGRLHKADSVSRELYAAALRLARHRGLLAGGEESVRHARQDFAAEVGQVLERLGRIARLETELLEEVLG